MINIQFIVSCVIRRNLLLKVRRSVLILFVRKRVLLITEFSSVLLFELRHIP